MAHQIYVICCISLILYSRFFTEVSKFSSKACYVHIDYSWTTIKAVAGWPDGPPICAGLALLENIHQLGFNHRAGHISRTHRHKVAKWELNNVNIRQNLVYFITFCFPNSNLVLLKKFLRINKISQINI